MKLEVGLVVGGDSEEKYVLSKELGRVKGADETC